MEDLLWVMECPGLIAEAGMPTVTDAECRKLLAQSSGEWARLRSDPGLLERFILLHQKSGRLGNRFETLLQFWLEKMLGVSEIAHGIAIREGGFTLGELDFVFRSHDGGVEHWEAAVKFFMCVAPTPELAARADSFVGQALVDRLDRKLALALEKQLPLATTPRAREVLASLGFTGPVRSRLFFKGRLFYPLAWNWRDVQGPSEVSPQHQRGWWISWEGADSIDGLVRAEKAAFSGVGRRAWVLLPKERWMGRVSESEASGGWLEEEQLRRRLDEHFASSRNALQLARVEQLSDGSWQEPPFDRGLGRGMILPPGWPGSV